MGDGGDFMPAPASVVRAIEDFRQLLRRAAHHLAAHRQPPIRQIHHTIRLEAGDFQQLRPTPALALIRTPEGPDAGRLVFMEMPEIVMIDDHHQPPVAQQAQARGHQPFVAPAQIGARHFVEFVPVPPQIIARQQRENLRLLRPVLIVIAVYQH